MNSAEKPLAELLGDDLSVPVFGGGTKRYVNLDNAATTPPLRRVWNRLATLMPWYGSVHRGAGFKSVVSTGVLEDAKKTIFQFSDGNADSDALFFGQNTTACVNHLARRMNLSRDSIVVTSELEHSSNLLPWRKHATALSCRTLANGNIDLEHLRDVVSKRQVRLVAVTAASNITGMLLDVHEIARIAHAHGARVLIDAAQFVAHRKLDRRPPNAPDHLDFVTYAGHKMYAPFGAAVLIGAKDVFSSGWSDQPGGGSVKLIDGEELVWADMPEREQGGTPNYVGVVALAEACITLEEIGFDKIAEHERTIMDHARMVFGEIDGVMTFGQLDVAAEDRVAVFPFGVRGVHHALVAAYLGAELAIGVRAGLICQYELIARLLNVNQEERIRARRDVTAGDQRQLYGIVRASCGLGSTIGDIDELGAALANLIRSGPAAKYEQKLDGRFEALGWIPSIVPA